MTRSRMTNLICWAAAMLSCVALFGQTGFVSGTVRGNGAPLDGASVMVEGGPRGTRTNADGKFSMELRAGSYSLTFTFVGFAPRTYQVGIQAGRELSLDVDLERDNTLDRVVVLGSRSVQQRSKTETAIPIDAFSARELQATGQVEPTQMINWLAPSFNSSRQAIADGTDHIDPATLRGLGPDQVLVLVNGRRRHNTALLNVNGTIGRGSVGTDLNAIPVAMIDKVEILRDGASSQYGSDAIAGVINLQLKRRDEGFEFSGQAGQQYAGDGTVWQGSVSQGLRIGQRGFITLGGDYRFRGATNRSGEYTGRVYTNDPVLDEQLIAQNGFSRRNNMQIGQSRLENLNGMFNAAVPLGDNLQLVATGGLARREGLAAGFYRYPRQTSQVITELYPNGFLPRIASSINDANLSVGLEGLLAGWRWDLSHTRGGNGFRFDVQNSNNASQFALGRNAQTDFYAGKLSFRQQLVQFNASRDFGQAVHLPSFNVAWGAEWRQDQYRIEAGEEASWRNYDPASGRVGGAQVFPGFQPANATDERRSVWAIYGDVETDISRSILVSFASRFEDYSDFGSNLAMKLSSRIRLAPWLNFRNAISTGFRAPSLHQFWYSSVSTLFIPTSAGLQPFQQGYFRNNSAVARAFGIESLRAENAINASAGFTAKWNSRWSATLDGYLIDIDDRIVLSGSFRRANAPEAALVDQLLGQFSELNDISAAAFFTNAVDTRTAGIDAVVNYTTLAGGGQLQLTGAMNVNKTTVRNVKEVGQVNDPLLKDRLFSREERARFEEGQPRDKIILSAQYSIGRLQAMLRTSRFGRVGSRDPNPAFADRDETFGPKWVTDLQASWQITEWLQWSAGALNLFDVYPDKLRNPANTSDGRFVYSRNAIQWGFNGGYYFTALRISL